MSWGFTWWGREFKREKRFALHTRNWPGPGPQPIGFTISLGYFHFFLMVWT